MLSEQLLPKSSGDSQPEVPPWRLRLGVKESFEPMEVLAFEPLIFHRKKHS